MHKLNDNNSSLKASLDIMTKDIDVWKEIYQKIKKELEELNISYSKLRTQ